MKIHFTKKEYRLLIDMINLADWVMHAHSVNPDEYHTDYQGIRKKLMSYHKEMGADDIIEYSKEMDDYFETREYEEELHERFIDNYNTEEFWEELIERLSERDAINKVGIDALSKMEPIKRISVLEEARELYVNEFEEHGLKNLKVSYDDLDKN